MYYDSKQNRVLLRNGKSVVSDFKFASDILNGKDTSHHVLRSEASEKYDFFYNTKLSIDIEEIEVESSNHEHTTDDVDYILNIIESSPRYKASVEEDDRISDELDFFIRSNNIVFLIEVRKLIEKFKEEGILWGVGRGSSCSSYVLYLLEVHDVNPIKYDIPFRELSKE